MEKKKEEERNCKLNYYNYNFFYASMLNMSFPPWKGGTLLGDDIALACPLESNDFFFFNLQRWEETD